jgi:hypothetical protein
MTGRAIAGMPLWWRVGGKHVERFPEGNVLG